MHDLYLDSLIRNLLFHLAQRYKPILKKDKYDTLQDKLHELIAEVDTIDDYIKKPKP